MWWCCTTPCCIISFSDALTAQEYVAEFIYNYGAWSEDLARDLWRRRARSGGRSGLFSLSDAEAGGRAFAGRDRSQPRRGGDGSGARARARRFTKSRICSRRPPNLPPDAEVIRWRAAHGVAPRTLLVGVFGHLRESKRLASVLRAFQRARGACEIALLVAGEFVSSDLERAITPVLRANPGIIRIGYVSEREFWLQAAAVDACINLRHPTAGETSGIGVRLMGIGKPVLVTAGEETARFPDSACLRVDPGPAEEEMLAEYLVWLARYPEDARAMGERAAGAYPRVSRPRTRRPAVLAGACGLLS